MLLMYLQEKENEAFLGKRDSLLQILSTGDKSSNLLYVSMEIFNNKQVTDSVICAK